jgi:DNA-binding beta-propeller fold protein YncE
MRPGIGLAVAALVLASCAAQVSGPPRSSANEELVLRTSSAVQVRDVNGELIRSLGRAVGSPDGSVFYTLDAASPSTLHWVDAKSGRAITQLGLAGSYSFADERQLGPSGLSPNGRWLVLVGEAGTSSKFAVIDTALVKLAAVAQVPGPFTYDAISDDGTSLYLIERITPQTARQLGLNTTYGYRVRVYDVPGAKLSETLVVDVKLASQTVGDSNAETRVDGIMNGIYQSSVPSRDGLWNFSFYYNPNRGPFIHVLHLDSRNAFCILDLPIVSGGYEKRLAWSLALTPSGQTLYAVNGALGLVSSIDAATLKVTRTATIAGLPSPNAAAPSVSSSATVAQDARKLWFAAARGVALVDTRDFALRGMFLPDQVVTSISLSPDGSRLYALSALGTVWMIEATTGRELAQIPAHGATALLRVATPSSTAAPPAR